MDPLPYSELCRRVLAIYSSPAYAPNTRRGIARLLKQVSRLEPVTSAELTTELAARYACLRSAEVSANTVRGELGRLRAVANLAVDEGWLDRPPRLRRVLPRSEPPATRRLHSIEDVGRVLDSLRARREDWRAHRLFVLVALAAYTGARRNELLRIQLADVDLDKRLIQVSWRQRLKTEAAAAPVPICDELLDVLIDWVPRAGPVWLLPGQRRVGPWIGGHDRSRPDVQIRAVGLEHGVPGLTLQSLRHTFATWCRRRWGLSGLQLRDVLRHTTPETQEHYVHADLERGPLVASVARVSYR